MVRTTGAHPHDPLQGTRAAGEADGGLGGLPRCVGGRRHSPQCVLHLLDDASRAIDQSRLTGTCTLFLTIVYRPSLARRLTRLEKMLDIPYKERHVCDGSLAEPIIVTLSAPRIRVVPPPAGSDDSEDEVDGQGAKKRTGGEGATTYGTKSAWVGREGGEVGVEQWVLEQWEDKGWKGFVASRSVFPWSPRTDD